MVAGHHSELLEHGFMLIYKHIQHLDEVGTVFIPL